MSKELIELALDFGWSQHKLNGEVVLVFDLGDRLLRSYPRTSKTTDHFIWLDGSNVWFEEFALAASYITQTDAQMSSLVQRKQARIKSPGRLDQTFVSQSTNLLTEWARSIDPQTQLNQYAEIKEQYGLRSEDHLISLALLGNTERLKQLRHEMVTKGCVSCLHPKLVQPETLERALILGEAMSSGQSIELFVQSDPPKF